MRAAAWSPDGSQIALVGPSLVAIVPADGGPVRGLAESVGITVNTEGQPYPNLVVLSGSDFDWQPLNASDAGHARRCHGVRGGRGGAGPGHAMPGLVADCAALLEVRQALAGGGALNWSVDRPMTAWDGLTLDGAPLRVQALALGESTLYAAAGARRAAPAAAGGVGQADAPPGAASCPAIASRGRSRRSWGS